MNSPGLGSTEGNPFGRGLAMVRRVTQGASIHKSFQAEKTYTARFSNGAASADEVRSQ
jgi:hypothetical protein